MARSQVSLVWFAACCSSATTARPDWSVGSSSRGLSLGANLSTASGASVERCLIAADSTIPTDVTFPHRTIANALGHSTKFRHRQKLFGRGAKFQVSIPTPIAPLVESGQDLRGDIPRKA